MAESGYSTEKIEYLIRSSDGLQDWDLLVSDLEVLVPQDIDCRQVPDQPVLTVRKELWQVAYSAEDPGWQLSFSKYATQLDCWSFASAVAEQIEQATGISTTAIQIAGFDGAIFKCSGSFGLQTRDYVVFEGEVVHGEVDKTMSVFLPTNATGLRRLAMESIEYVDRSNQHESGLGLVCVCEDWDEVQALTRIDLAGEHLEVSHRPVVDVVEQMEAVEEIVEPHRQLVERVSEVLFRHDPIGIDYETNADEYDAEAATIVMRLLDISELTPTRVLQVVHEEFVRWFSIETAGPIQDYEQVAAEVMRIVGVDFGRSEREGKHGSGEING